MEKGQGIGPVLLLSGGLYFLETMIYDVHVEVNCRAEQWQSAFDIVTQGFMLE